MRLCELYHNIKTTGMKINEQDVWSSMSFVKECRSLVYSNFFLNFACQYFEDVKNCGKSDPPSVVFVCLINVHSKWKHKRSWNFSYIVSYIGIYSFLLWAHVTWLLTQNDVISPWRILFTSETLHFNHINILKELKVWEITPSWKTLKFIA